MGQQPTNGDSGPQDHGEPVVPVIDIGALVAGDAAGTATAVAQIDHACREIGFFQITGHGVDPELVETMYTTSRRFFDLPLPAKRGVAQPNPETIRGYCAVGEQSFAYSDGIETPRDLHEKFDVGPVDVPADDPYYAPEHAGAHFLPNQWPAEPSGMEQVWTDYFHAMNDLCRLLMSAFARALDLPADFFADKIDKDISMLRAINYPHSDQPPLPGQLRAGAHTDYGSLTIVRQEEAPGGLQVFTQDGDWLRVPVVPGAFVVNIGDLMAQWTNDLWISTRHRVANPPAGTGDTRRMSLVFFHQPNYDAMVECLPSCLSAGEQPRYEPIASGDHLMNKFVKTISVEPAAGLASTVTPAGAGG
ncbi:Isopenicillin N synthase [Jatrophihabitans endophyticus]|uniref:Isopenicillin N synthase n=1 Tax=Jatrophihabitans endophyticus TaxID=1206085 RepID=A0A1M5P915_9ACTN|nr:2-oxoglutarate and iron-dependent oxygenase domain-containing protein [Jatrophihabitans endophyticus]SHG97939.1 Isopenicillin N synthase [Jatrophihabitans endophyticus]